MKRTRPLEAMKASGVSRASTETGPPARATRLSSPPDARKITPSVSSASGPSASSVTREEKLPSAGARHSAEGAPLTQ